MSRLTRNAYADMYGPTTGDRVRLGDTELIIEVEEDRATYGDEVKFGGGKVIRDGMGQSQRPSEKCLNVWAHRPNHSKSQVGDLMCLSP